MAWIKSYKLCRNSESRYHLITNLGLRIAPPEAPVSGYLYGKGIYFADMASKSLNYCYPTNKEGLILLCEVAVGNFSEKFQPDYNSSNLPKGKHSTKAIGDIYPPQESYINHDGIQIPIGEPIHQNGVIY
jgi:poly [ADP-ribose] polymerase